VRVDRAGGGVTIGRPVAELEPLGVPAALGDGDQRIRIDPLTGRAGKRNRVGDLPERVDPATQPGRHHLDQLGQRPDRGLLDPGDRALRGGLHADRERHRLVVVDDQRRQRGSGGELVATLNAAVRLDRVAELAQPVDVATKGANRHLESVSQVGPRPVPVGLQQREQPQRARARVGHEPSIS